MRYVAIVEKSLQLLERIVVGFASSWRSR